MVDCQKEWLDLVAEYTGERGSYTLRSAPSLAPFLCKLRVQLPSIRRIVDLGSGFGGLALSIGKFLHAAEVVGIDINEERIRVARKRGLEVLKIDLEKEQIPIQNGDADLVTSFGAIEHLTWWDNALSETNRILRHGGHFVLSIPNLRSYVYVLSLTLGYQPRDIEVSRKYLAGVLPVYKNDRPADHVHTVTLKAIRELLEKFGFSIVMVKPLRPKLKNPLWDVIDRLACARPSTARRFVLAAKKERSII